MDWFRCPASSEYAVLEHYPNFVISMVINRDKESIKRLATTEKIYLKAASIKQVGQAIEHSRSIICQFLKDKDALILFAGMGGLSGTFASPLIADFAKDLQLPVLAFITLPFGFEGEARMECALKGESRLIASGATIMTYSNQDIIETAPANTSMLDAFRLVNQEILKLIEPYLINQ